MGDAHLTEQIASHDRFAHKQADGVGLQIQFQIAVDKAAVGGIAQKRTPIVNLDLDRGTWRALAAGVGGQGGVHVAHALLAARVDRRRFGVGHVLAVEDV